MNILPYLVSIFFCYFSFVSVQVFAETSPVLSFPDTQESQSVSVALTTALSVQIEQPTTIEFLSEGALSSSGSKIKSKNKKDLMGYWSFDEVVGSTVFDQSGYENHGELTNAAIGEGKFGEGLILAGTGGLKVLNSESLNSLPKGFTLSAWIKSTSYPDFTTIFWKTDRHNRIHQLHFQVDGRLHAAMNQPEPEGGFQGFSPFVVPLDEWHYVTWTHDKKYHRFYDNGEEVFKLRHKDPWVGNSVDLLIGFHPEVSSANFHGFIDEARIYRKALSQKKIKKDMKSSLLLPA